MRFLKLDRSDHWAFGLTAIVAVAAKQNLGDFAILLTKPQASGS